MIETIKMMATELSSDCTQDVSDAWFDAVVRMSSNKATHAKACSIRMDRS